MDYQQDDVVRAVRGIVPAGVDIVVEVAPAQNLQTDLAVIRPRGTISIYANNGGDQLSFPVRGMFSTNVRLQGVLLYTVGPAALAAAAQDVTAAVADGAFGVGEERGLPLHHYPLERTAAAHDAVEGGIVGKVLIDVAQG